MWSGRRVSLGAMAGLLAAAAAGAILLLGCKKSGDKSAKAEITFHHDIAPIVWKNCAGCHRRGEVAPFELITFEQVKKHAAQMAKVTQSRFMPPWLPEKGYGEFADERRLSDEQIDLIATWVKQGCAEGKSEGAASPQWVDGWQLGKPDVVARMPASYGLAAEGKDVYRNFVVPLEVNEPRWVRAVEFRVGT